MGEARDGICVVGSEWRGSIRFPECGAARRMEGCRGELAVIVDGIRSAEPWFILGWDDEFVGRPSVASGHTPTIHQKSFLLIPVLMKKKKLTSSLLPLFSWELGTRAETLTELNTPSLSVLTPGASLPPPTSLNTTLNSSLSTVFSIARSVVSNRSFSNKNATGAQPLISDSAAGDPASMGVAVLLANWTGLGSSGGDGEEVDYAGAATDQLNYLFEVVPKTSDGAISHRVAQVQLWFVSESPFLRKHTRGWNAEMCVCFCGTGVIRCIWSRRSSRIMESRRIMSLWSLRRTTRCVCTFRPTIVLWLKVYVYADVHS